MKYAKVIGVLAIMVVALMVLASTAAATEGTDSAEGSPVETGDVFHAVAEGSTSLDGTVNITCQNSTVLGHIENPGSATTTLLAKLTTFTFEECGNTTITVVNTGTMEIHTDTPEVDDGNGVLTSTGVQVTVLTHNILGTVHCLYVTEETSVGTLTGSNHQLSTEKPQTATLDIGSSGIQRLATDFGCGNSSVWTGSYSVTSPDYLYIH
jgi:hypothetical protein